MILKNKIMEKIMKLTYQTFDFKISFNDDIYIKNPVFTFRSIIGMNLRRKACIQRNSSCGECFIKNNCAYSYLFETHINKNNSTINGRNRGTHPMIINSVTRINKTNDFIVKITLFGNALNYTPFVLYALQEAGQKGVLKNRQKYIVRDVLCNGKSILKNNEIQENPPSNYIEIGVNDNNKIIKKFEFVLKSPFRYKKNGKYIQDISFQDVLIAINRRINILFGLFGDGEIIDFGLPDILNESIDVYWVDKTYYSSRQKRSIKLGGLKGKIFAELNLDSNWITILKLLPVIHIGKNVSFGLGSVVLLEKL